ncbi:MAG: stage V sporulation protein S [Erysipelotrichaceae bacterium]|nr:stage V sporulation protein S [Erysipelotrichaceae bacterium]
MEIMKVSSESNASLVAGALANIIRTQETVTMLVIGAGALNQAIKAVAIARGFIVPTGKDLTIIPSFKELIVDEKERTAINLLVKLV